MVITDNQCNYGVGHSHKRNIKRFESIGNSTLLGFFIHLVSSGEYSDFQQLGFELQKKAKNDSLMDDGVKYTAKELAHYAGSFSQLASLLYKKRNDFDPYFTANIICGRSNGASYISIIDMYGNKFDNDIVMSGLADYLCCSLARRYYHPDMTEDEATNFLSNCMKVIYAKNRLTGNQFFNLPLV